MSICIEMGWKYPQASLMFQMNASSVENALLSAPIEFAVFISSVVLSCEQDVTQKRGCGGIRHCLIGKGWCQASEVAMSFWQ